MELCSVRDKVEDEYLRGMVGTLKRGRLNYRQGPFLHLFSVHGSCIHVVGMGHGRMGLAFFWERNWAEISRLTSFSPDVVFTHLSS